MTRQPYLFSPIGDAFFTGGFSLLVFAVFFFMEGPELAAWSLSASIFLLWFVNWPHFSATLYRLYHSGEQANQYPFTAFVSPLIFIGIAALVFTQKGPAATVPLHLYAIWAPFHFSSQSLGISFIYLRRRGIQLNANERRAFVWFCHSSLLYMLARVESLTQIQRFGALSYPTLQLPRVAVTLATWAFFGCSFIWAVTLVRSYRERKQCFPWICFVPVVTQVIWFVVGPYSPSFNQLVPMFRSLQYLPIVWWMQMQKEGFSWKHSFRWMRINFLGGAVLFWGIPVLLSVVGFSLEIARIAVFTAINLHHFYIDGVIWKLRNPKVSAPLIFDRFDRSRPEVSTS